MRINFNNEHTIHRIVIIELSVQTTYLCYTQESFIHDSDGLHLPFLNRRGKPSANGKFHSIPEPNASHIDRHNAGTYGGI